MKHDIFKKSQTMRNLITILVFPLVFYSCITKTECEGVWFWASYQGFDSTELSVFVTNTYVKGSDFKSLLKSDTIDGSKTYSDPGWPGSGRSFGLGADYEFILPLAGRTDRITDVYYELRTDKYLNLLGGEAEPCYNEGNCTLNGVQNAAVQYETKVQVTIKK
jgi:hypothetical protein